MQHGSGSEDHTGGWTADRVPRRGQGRRECGGAGKNCSEEVLGLMARDAEADVVSALDQAVASARSAGAALLVKDS